MNVPAPEVRSSDSVRTRTLEKSSASDRDRQGSVSMRYDCGSSRVRCDTALPFLIIGFHTA
jgi:hypothetical protein